MWGLIAMLLAVLLVALDMSRGDRQRRVPVRGIVIGTIIVLVGILLSRVDFPVISLGFVRDEQFQKQVSETGQTLKTIQENQTQLTTQMTQLNNHAKDLDGKLENLSSKTEAIASTLMKLDELTNNLQDKIMMVETLSQKMQAAGRLTDRFAVELAQTRQAIDGFIAKFQRSIAVDNVKAKENKCPPNLSDFFRPVNLQELGNSAMSSNNPLLLASFVKDIDANGDGIVCIVPFFRAFLLENKPAE